MANQNLLIPVPLVQALVLYLRKRPHEEVDDFLKELQKQASLHECPKPPAVGQEVQSS